MGRFGKVLINQETDLEYSILSVMQKYNEPIGAGLICQRLIDRGMVIGEAKIGRFLRKLDYKKLTKRVGYQGRVITDEGKEYLKELKLKRYQNLYGFELIDYFNRNNPNEIIDILVVRRVLEMEAARLAAIHGTNEEIRELEKAVNESKKNQEFGNDSGEYDSFFHNMISNMSKNKILIYAMNLISMNKQLHNLFVHIRKRVGSAMIIDHINIVNAIKERNPEKAAENMGKHIDTVIDDVITYLNSPNAEALR